MQQQDLRDLNTFIVVAERLSFRAAATKLNVTPSAVSQAVKRIEERLSVDLLHRTTRSVSLTHAGRQLLEQIAPLYREIDSALNNLETQRKTPSGRLKIYTTQFAAHAFIMPVWQAFLGAYPDVQLDLEVGEAGIDLVERGFDAGIWPRNWAPMEMVAAKLTDPMRMAVVGSPAYFADHCPPKTPDDLQKHRCILFRRGSDNMITPWPFRRDSLTFHPAVNGQVIVNSSELNIRAALDGLGLAYAIEAYAEPFLNSGQLVQVLKDWTLFAHDLCLYYPKSRQISSTLRAFIDLITHNRL